MIGGMLLMVACFDGDVVTKNGCGCQEDAVKDYGSGNACSLGTTTARGFFRMFFDVIVL